MDPDYGIHYRELYEKHWWWRAREELLVEEVRRQFPAGRRISILDVGCGDGLFFERLKEFGEVEGIEPAGEIVSPSGPRRARITVAPFDPSFQPGRKFNLILMLDVLEHLAEPQEALRHALSLLVPGGMVLITVPAFRLLWTKHDVLNQHRARFTKRSFERVAKAAGMKVQEARYFFVWLFGAKVLARIRERFTRSAPQVPRIPVDGVNRALFHLSRMEGKITRLLPAPFGSSLLVWGKRSKDQ